MKKFFAMFLAVVMVFALGVNAFADDTTPTTKLTIGNGLDVEVDYDIEGMYFDDTTLKNAADNGYYPYSFSLIASDRALVDSIVVSNGSFHWAYAKNADGSYVTDADGNYVESTTTKYGVVVLPTDSASTVTVTAKALDDDTPAKTKVLTCAQPSGGTTAPGAELYAYLPAPAQFVNEGVTTGGWGDAYDSAGNLKSTSSTGLSLGFFGGYAVYKFKSPVYNTDEHPYGADFIVYGNAFWNNSEAGCIQVSPGPDDNGDWTWYDIAGSMYYTKSTPGATITYTNPNPGEDATITTPATNLGTLAPVTYNLNGTTGTVTTNTFHKHSWFPLNVNYFVDSGTRTEMAKADLEHMSFVSRTLDSNNITSTLTFTGTLLNDYPGTGKTAEIGFGYCDVHANRSLGSTTAYNPYQSFTDSSDYNTKTEGTGGGDPIDIAWAVNSDGTPANLESIKFVRIYTGMAQMNGIFGEISTEVCGVAACDAITGTGAAQAAPTVTISVGGETYNLDMTGKNLETVPDEDLQATASITGAETYTITVTDANASHIFVNGEAVTSGTAKTLTVPTDAGHVQIITQTGDRSPFIAVIEN